MSDKICGNCRHFERVDTIWYCGHPSEVGHGCTLTLKEHDTCDLFEPSLPTEEELGFPMEAPIYNFDDFKPHSNDTSNPAQ